MEDSGHMIACDSCSCWSHSSCVNIPPTVADKYFLCPFCIKSNLLSISTFRSEISLLKAYVIKLEKLCCSLTSSSTESIKVSNTLDSLSAKVQSTVHSLPTSVPSSSITSNTADNPTPSISQHITPALSFISDSNNSLISSVSQPITTSPSSSSKSNTNNSPTTSIIQPTTNLPSSSTISKSNTTIFSTSKPTSNLFLSRINAPFLAKGHRSSRKPPYLPLPSNLPPHLPPHTLPLPPPPQPSIHSNLSSTHPPSTPLPLPTSHQYQPPLFSNFHQSLHPPLPPLPAIFSNAPVPPPLSTTFHSRLPPSTLHPNLLLLLPPPPLHSSNPAPHPPPTLQSNLPLSSKPRLLPSPPSINYYQLTNTSILLL